MKHILSFLMILFYFSAILPAQNIYTWIDKKISFQSPVNLKILSSSGSFILSGSDIDIDISTLGGMEGVTGLPGSLDSYAKSFYSNVGQSISLSAENMNAAKISAQKDGKSVILVMLATKDYKQHFVCEIIYNPINKTVVESIIKSIVYDDEDYDNNVIIEYEENNNNNSNENIVMDDTDVNQNDTNDDRLSDLKPGTVPPDFTLFDVNDKSFPLSSLKGKIVLLDFWGTWCAPCIKSIPELKELYSKYKGNDFEIVSIANDNDKSKWKNVVSNKGMNWINVIDLDENVTHQFNISAYPTLLLIGKNGKLIYVNTEINEVESYLIANIEKNNADDYYHDQTIENNENVKDNPNNNPEQTIINPKVKNTHLNGNSIEIKTWQLLADYSGDGYIILDDFYSAPNEYQGTSISDDQEFKVWIDGSNEKDIVRSSNTVVHEMCHGYTSKLYLKMLTEEGITLQEGGYSAYYLGNRKAKLVSHTDVFFTSKINSVFPKNLITDRYETYVYPSEKIMGSQQYGPYGLLDELNAYYWGTKVSYDFYDYYKMKYNSVDGWTDFFNGFYGTFYAYLEFKSYILVYMIYAKQNQSEVYNKVMQNKDFLYAFRCVDENWSNLILAFNTLKKNIANDQKDKGIDISETEEFIYFGNQGSGNFIDIYNKFNRELKTAKYQSMAKEMGLLSAGGPEIELIIGN